MKHLIQPNNILLRQQSFRLLKIVILASSLVSHAALGHSRSHTDQTVYTPEIFPSPFGFTRIEASRTLFIPNTNDIQLIERLATGIHRWKTTRDHGWWECGEYLETGPDTEDRAILLAYNLVRAANLKSDAQIRINVWGLAATIAHESSFDRCAVGVHFRRWAIDKKLIAPRTRTISYGEEELLTALTSPQAAWWFENTGVDVGYCQLLTRFYDGDLRDMMDPCIGLNICAEHFRKRSEMLRTDRPWRWWRGYQAEWYEQRVVHRARTLGANRNEI